jgi:hypothetical protein
MEECKVYHLLGIKGGGLLLVFHTNSRAYQFRVVTAKGEVMGECSLFYTAKAALLEGLKWIGNGERE